MFCIIGMIGLQPVFSQEKQVYLEHVKNTEKNGGILVNNSYSFFAKSKSKNIKSSPTITKSSSSPTIDLNSIATGNDHDFQMQPTPTGLFSTVISPIITSTTNTITSATITMSGVQDSSNGELFGINNGAGFDLYFFNPPVDTNVYTFPGSVIRMTQVSSTDFTVTEDSGNPIPNEDFQEFLKMVLYGDIASPYTDGVRVMTVTITDTNGDTASAQSTIRVFTTPPTVIDENNVISANNTGTITGNVLANDSGSSIVVTEVDVYPAMVGNTYTTLYGEITIQSDGSYSYNVDENNASVTGLRAGESLQDIISYTVTDANNISDYGILTIRIDGVDEAPDAINNEDAVTAFTDANTQGNIITDVGAGGVDEVDRGVSTLVWENEFTQGSVFLNLSDEIGGTSRTVNGVTLDFTSTDPSSFGVPDQNQVVFLTQMNGGHTGYLGFTIDGVTNPSDDTELVINFSEPVYNLGFLVVDIDFSQSNTWQDQIKIEGTLNGVNSNYQYVTTGGVVDAGNNTFYGIGRAVEADATGNVNVFFEEPIDQLRLGYNYGPHATAANQGAQIAGVSDIYWQGGAGAIVISEIDGGVVAAGGTLFTGMYGTLFVTPDGNYTYTPDTTNPTVQALLVGQTLTDTFNYRLTDGFGFDNADLIITINGSGIDSDGDTIADRIDLDDDNDGILDTDEGCVSTVLSTSGTLSNGVAYTTSGAGLIDLGGGDLQLGDFGVNGTVTFTFSEPVEITITNTTAINHAIWEALDPVRTTTMTSNGSTWEYIPGTVDPQINIVGNQAISTLPNSSLSSQDDWGSITSRGVTTLSVYVVNFDKYNFQIVSCVDTDGDGITNDLDLDSDGDGCPDALEGDSVTITSANLTTASGTLQGGNSGPGYTGTSGISITDNLGIVVGSTPTTLGVPTITGTGQGIGASQNGADATVCINLIASDDTATVPEDDSVVIDIFNNDNDIPTDGTLVISSPSNGTITVNNGGTPNNPADDIVTYIPDTDFNGTDTFTYTVCDNASPTNCANATVSITVTPVNDTPTANDDIATVAEDGSVTISVVSNDDFGGDGPSSTDITI
ncbi:VCBS domain-containing protein, partial [Tenacibaculum amylolyticum]|uniref:VCBS domain-containing protein n=1 Tax=Tenacibaculum amylolyticum TaxID=104269 RepID=UPI0038B65AAD